MNDNDFPKRVFVRICMTVLGIFLFLMPALYAKEDANKELTAYYDQETSDVIMANEHIQLRFHRGQPRFGTFPDGYTGYTLYARNKDAWLPVATAPYFSAGSYATYWGRDFLSYALPDNHVINKDDKTATVTFTQDMHLGDWIAWQLSFSFTITADRPVVDVVYQSKVLYGQEVLLFWGPRLYVGEGSFGADKDEAMFPGLEHLYADEQSSDIWSLAPDIKLNFAPHPAKITVPLMTVLKDGLMVGMMWDPMQKWYKDHTCPTAVFASPNWIERKNNHLMGLFVPSIPEYVAENTLRAHSPVIVDEGDVMTITAKLFAAPATHAIEAIDLYLIEYGGLPEIESRPVDDSAALHLLVRGLVECWDSDAKGWPWTIGSPPLPHANILSTLLKAKPLLEDNELIQQVDKITTETLEKQDVFGLDLALRIGGVEKILEDWSRRAASMVAAQNPDGSWGATPDPLGEEGLAIWNAPPDPGYIGLEGERSQGITAASIAWLTYYAMLTNDEKTFKACLRGLKDMDQYTIPYTFYNEECPRAVSLHGSYLGLRACLNAYRITGDQTWLDKAVYWAKTGMQFIYVWSLPPRESETGHIHSNIPALLDGEDLYKDTIRDPMLYASLYGYGSSQFMHHWFGLPVQWIGLAYADEIYTLSQYDQSLDWRKIADGLCNSCLWMTFDKEPFTGYYPDAFNLITWVPSGPAITPWDLLRAFLHCKYDISNERTVILREGQNRYHITAMAKITNEQIEENILTFTLDDPGWSHCHALVTNIPADVDIKVDDQELHYVNDIDTSNEGWSRSVNDLVIIKVEQGDIPREIKIRM